MRVTKPSFVIGYWRPWEKNSSFTESWFNYIKDKSLVDYGSKTVGTFIDQASKEQVNAINNLQVSVTQGIDQLSSQIQNVNLSLEFVNRNLDLQHEQQRLTNILLNDISKLLRVPDSEKERQRSIVLGIKFFINAQKDPDLYEDALEELNKAEKLMRQDYFVLHRIGLVYLYADDFIDLEKAQSYFERAAKYASVESDPEARLLANLLLEEELTSFEQQNEIKNEGQSLLNRIHSIAADSYEKAALSSYILGQTDKAINYQKKAVYYYPSAINYYYLGKYYARVQDEKQVLECIMKAKEIKPEVIDGVIYDLDYLSIPLICDYYTQEFNNIDNIIFNHIGALQELIDEETKKEIISLKYTPSEYKIYSEKYNFYKRLDALCKKQKVKRKEIIWELEDLRQEIKKSLKLLGGKDKGGKFNESLNVQNQTLRELSIYHKSLNKELISLNNQISIIKKEQSLQKKEKEERAIKAEKEKEKRKDLWGARLLWFGIWGVLMGVLAFSGDLDLARLIFKFASLLYILASLFAKLTLGSELRLSVFFYIILLLWLLI